MKGFEDHRLEEKLADQPVTDLELKEILRRLGELESCVNALPTIGDISEATSREPAEIGRLLALIRKEAWEDRFGIRIEDHEQRLEQIESRLNPTVASPPVQYVYSPISEKQRIQLQYLIEKDRSKSPALLIVGLVLAAAIIAAGYVYLVYLV
jgi:hypothetical protein